MIENDKTDEGTSQRYYENGPGISYPWDDWAEDDKEKKKLPFKDNEFLFKEDEEPTADDIAEEEEFFGRLERIQIYSHSIEAAKGNPKAEAYFAQPPNDFQGYDHLWVSAVDGPCWKNLVGLFRTYGVDILHNFDDWEDTSDEDKLFSIEDIASYKARKCFELTGKPCIASRTSWEIEPVRSTESMASGSASRNVVSSKLGPGNPRITSGYKFNDFGAHVEQLCAALLPYSEPTRVTRFTTCICFYDGEIEFYEYGVCDVDLYFCNLMRIFISMGMAVNEMLETLQLTFDLQYQKWLTSQLDEVDAGGYGKATLRLRDRVLKEGRVLPNAIIDVSSFMDSMVDVSLMDECGEELARRFIDQRPTKILTIATTGLVIAIPLAKYLEVPVVYARKERSVVMSDIYKTLYTSKTVGQNKELLVSKRHLSTEDRILIIDDFLSSGSSQEALLRIVSESGATPVGVGVLIEKVYESGRQSLSGFNIPVESIVRVASVQDGIIQLFEEAGIEEIYS